MYNQLISEWQLHKHNQQKAKSMRKKFWKSLYVNHKTDMIFIQFIFKIENRKINSVPEYHF